MIPTVVIPPVTVTPAIPKVMAVYSATVQGTEEMGTSAASSPVTAKGPVMATTTVTKAWFPHCWAEACNIALEAKETAMVHTGIRSAAAVFCTAERA